MLVFSTEFLFYAILYFEKNGFYYGREGYSCLWKGVSWAGIGRDWYKTCLSAHCWMRTFCWYYKQHLPVG